MREATWPRRATVMASATSWDSACPSIEVRTQCENGRAVPSMSLVSGASSARW
jgi:hypothetical protein